LRLSQRLKLVREQPSLRAQLDSVPERERLLESVRSIRPYEEFYREYRFQAQRTHDLLTPQHAGTERRMPFDHLYVVPDLDVLDHRATLFGVGRRELDRPRVDASRVTEVSNRTVILGPPGAGKSTLARYVLRELCKRESGTVPVLITLRDYSVDRSERRDSLLTHIENTLRNTYLCREPSGPVEYMLIQGRGLLIFDGLDEVVSIVDRQAVRDDIERLLVKYPATRALVLSRVVGYGEAPLDPQFLTLKLDEFSDEQVAQYARSWFAEVSDLRQREKEEQTADFLRESRKEAPDLRRNPLILGLLCNLYRGRGSIPPNRTQVYGRCAELLLSQWDAQRRVRYEPPLGEDLQPTLEHIAQWIFAEPLRQRGVARDELIEEAAEHLVRARYGPARRRDALNAAREFCEFCSGRAWVITEVGRGRGDTPLFQFVHRTFLEYYAASYHVRSRDSIGEVADFIAEAIRQPGWEVLAELAIGIQVQDRRNAADMLLERLTHEALSEGARREELIFVLRYLTYVLPSPGTVSSAIGRLVRATVKVGGANDATFDASADNVVTSLEVHSANRDSTIDSTVQALRALLTGPADQAATRAALITGIIRYRSRHEPSWQGRVTQLLREERRAVHRILGSHLDDSVRLWRLGAVGVEDVLSVGGAAALFRVPARRGWSEARAKLSTTSQHSIVPVILRQLVSASEDEGPGLEQAFAELASLLVDAPRPWLAIDDVRQLDRPAVWLREGAVGATAPFPEDTPPSGWSIEARQGVILGLLPFAEWFIADSQVSRAWGTMKDLELSLPPLAVELAQARQRPRRHSREVRAERRWGTAGPAGAFLLAWRRGEVSVVAIS
jgi:hypothetical protein